VDSATVAGSPMRGRFLAGSCVAEEGPLGLDAMSVSGCAWKGPLLYAKMKSFCLNATRERSLFNKKIGFPFFGGGESISELRSNRSRAFVALRVTALWIF
jgi:hypothetical protein